MEQLVKERIIGAIVVTLLAVIFIPWILDGQTQVPAHEQSLTLPNQTTAQTFDLSLEAPRPAKPQALQPKKNIALPNVAAKPPVEDKPALKPQPKPQPKPKAEATVKPKPAVQPQLKPTPKPDTKPKPEPQPSVDAAKKIKPPAAKPAPTPSVPGDYWAAQVGSFGARDNAERLAKKLNQMGYTAFVSRYAMDANRVLFRVRVGPYEFKEQANHAADRLRRTVDSVSVVAHP